MWPPVPHMAPDPDLGGGPGTLTWPVLPDPLWHLFLPKGVSCPAPAQSPCQAYCSWPQGSRSLLVIWLLCSSFQGYLSQFLMPKPELSSGTGTRWVCPFIFPNWRPGPGTALVSIGYQSLEDRGISQKDGCHFQATYSCIETNEHVWNLKICDSFFWWQ